jgi:outer membrane protein assembly factor BamB
MAVAGDYFVIFVGSNTETIAYFYDRQGNQVSTEYLFTQLKGVFWHQATSRLYTVVNDGLGQGLGYFQLSSTGTVYHWDTYYDGRSRSTPLAASPSGDTLFDGAGNLHNTADLSFDSTLSAAVDFATWHEEIGLTLAQNIIDGDEKSFDIVRHDASLEALEWLSFEGELLSLNAVDNQLFLLYRQGQALHTKLITPSDDSDNDGVANAEDAFPNDVAASVDSDRDGFPDAWNTDYDQSDSSTGLLLDAFPDDALCQTSDQNAGSGCDIHTLSIIEPATQVILQDGIIYSLNASGKSINRWQTATESSLNPILLDSEALGLAALSFTVTDKTLLVNYRNGAIYEYTLATPVTKQKFAKLPTSASYLWSLSNGNILLGEETEYSTRMQLYSAEGSPLGNYNSDIEQRLVFNRQSNQIYGFETNYVHYLSLYTPNIDTGNSITSDYASLEDGYPAPNTIFANSDSSLIVVNKEAVITDADSGNPTQTQLPISSVLSASAQLNNVQFLQGINSAIFSDGNDHYLTLYSEDLSQLVHTTLLSNTVLNAQADEQNVYLLEQLDNDQLRWAKLALSGDNDSDGLPSWWELASDFDDDNASDANRDTDADGLTNLQEYRAGTSALTQDTDGDGLSDGEEINDYGLNPLANDTDGDDMPDNWEISYGFNANDASDRNLDFDADGVSNYLEFAGGSNPDDETSTPEFIADEFYSFELDALPERWSVSAADDSTAFTTQAALDGQYSYQLSGDATIVWQGLFQATDISLHILTDCYSYYSKEIAIYLDDSLFDTIYVSQVDWAKLNIPVTGDQHELRFEISSNNDNCSLFIDSVGVTPLQSLFEAGISYLSTDTENIYLHNQQDEIVQTIKYQAASGFSTWVRDLVVLTDGRIAVHNGTSTPQLSVYQPSENLWQHFSAPAWSAPYSNSQAGIALVDQRVLLPNVANYGSDSHGLVEFDLAQGSVDYIDSINDSEYTNVVMGLDGYLYTLSYSQLTKHDANTLELIETYEWYSYPEDFVVDENGFIYAGDYNQLRQIDITNGAIVVKQLRFENYDFWVSDIDIRSNDDIYLTSQAGNIIQTTTALDDFEFVPSQSAFVAFTPNTDADIDGLPDWWEGANNLSANDAQDAQSDLDGDGLTALEEYDLNTSATNADSDADGLSDGDEFFIHQSNPLSQDSDGDGLNDGEEAALLTDLNNADSDNDQISDYDEVNLYNTSPLAVDSDNDGMSDWYEVSNNLNPIEDDSSADSDADGLNNGEEFSAGTDPNNADTDGDSLTDFDEVTTHFTSPLQSDTDADLMDDAWEVSYTLDPLDPSDAQTDSDNDQFTNIEEHQFASQPLDAGSTPQAIEWHSHQGDENHTGYTPLILAPENFSFLWQQQWNSLSAIDPVTATTDKVFVTSADYSNPEIYALDSSNGEILWNLSYNGINSIDPPAYYDGRVYFQTGGHDDSYLRAVDENTGELLFASAYGNQWSSYLAPTFYDGSVYVAGGYYGGVYAFDASSGQQTWYATGPQYDGFTPTVDEDYVYAFTERLDVYQRSTGDLVYTLDINDFSWGGYELNSSAIKTPSNNLVVNRHGSMALISLNDRAVVWQRPNSNFLSQPALGTNVVYAISNGTLYAIDETTGEDLWLWSEADLTSNVVVTKSHIFVSSDSQTFAIDVNTQQTVWSYNAGGKLSLASNGQLYIAGDKLVAISLQ